MNEIVPGYRFGTKVVVSDAGQDSKRNHLWLCQCDCGRRVVMNATKIRSGSNPSCASCTLRYRYGGVEKRFWGKVQKCGDGDCWLWTGSRNKFGHGHFNNQPIGNTAHRTAWFLTNGAIPDGMFVCHRCDNPPCVNPKHLFLGTNEDNMRDAAQKNRTAHGSRAHGSKLSEADIPVILEMLGKGISQSAIAVRFRVSQGQISRIKSGAIWTRAAAAGWRKDGDK